MKTFTKEIACLILWLMSSLLITGCMQRSKVIFTEKIDDRNSILIDSLVKRSDFDAKWIWVYESTFQEKRTPSISNSFIVDEATRGIEGYYGKIENLVEVWHSLYCHIYTAPEPSLSFSFKSNYHSYESGLIPVGENFIYECKQSEYQITCESIATYGNLTSNVVVDIPNSLANESNDIVNNVLGKLDSRLSTMSNCFQIK